MATLADIKLPTREEAEARINTVADADDYTFDGWGSKFKLQTFTTEGKEAKKYYPDEGFIGFSEVDVKEVAPSIQEVKTVSLASLTVGTEITPDDGYDYIAKIVIVD